MYDFKNFENSSKETQNDSEALIFNKIDYIMKCVFYFTKWTYYVSLLNWSIVNLIDFILFAIVFILKIQF